MKGFNFNYILGGLVIAVAALIIGRYFYFQPRFINGERAPDFQARTLEGEPFHLADLRGQYVLLDFWGSWCPPCRQENPQLVQLYEKYGDLNFKDAKGFEIVSIAIERDSESWKRAIRQDELKWPHHILDKTNSMRFFSGDIATQYGVREVPSKYLLDPEGRIIGVNPSPRALDQLLSRRVK